MKTESTTRQPQYVIEPLEFGRVRVTLYANETPVEREDGTHFIYDKYSADTPDRPALGQYISAHFDEWVNNYRATEISELASAVRAERDTKLAKCDWTQAADAPLTDDARVAWQEYRQALRNVPQQVNFPYNVEWPKI